MAATEDIEKFMEVFIKFEQDGQIIPYDPDYFDYANSHLRSYYIDSWVMYLRSQSNRLGDDFFDWYDDMTFESLNRNDLYSYRLPEEVIVLPLGNEEKFVTKIHQILSDWYDGCNVTSEDMAIVSINFSKNIISASYDLLTGFKKDAARAEFIKKSFDEALTAVQNAIVQFNEAQGTRAVNVEKGAHPEHARDVSNRAFVNDAGKLIRSENARSLAISFEDLFYSYNKKPAELSYKEKFFSIIEDDRSKGMTSIENNLSPTQFVEFIQNNKKSRTKEPVTN